MASSGEVWRLGRRPALDGIRGLAVLMVVACHAAIPAVAAAGQTGVTVFFTLSGFLITSLLLQEHDTFGCVSLGAFYRRRARRLLPGVFAMLAGVGAGMLLLGYTARWVVSQQVPVVLYYGNWVREQGVFVGSWSHTWSLSVEEQFYLAWPLLLLVLVRRWGELTAMAVCAVGVCYSIIARLVVWDDGHGLNRAYYGTDMHLDALLGGALLALVMRGRVVRPVNPAWLVAAAVGTGLLCLTGPDFGGTIVATTFAPPLAAVAIYAAAQIDVRALTWRPLVLVGRRSYGLYLWHYPVFALVAIRLPWQRPLVVAFCLALSWLLTLASWRFVEAPFLRLGRSAAPERSLALDAAAQPSL
jgi:peptidoglycan/LPS O-acetylase OafA/YrhL